MTTAAELQTATRAQVEQAVAGHPLASINAEPHPDFMNTGPSNDIGAAYRAAYWLAVASRIAQGQGDASATLTRAAAYYGAYASGEGSMLGWAVGAGRTASGSIAILQESAAIAAQAGIGDVAAKLRGLGTPTAIIQQQQAEAKQHSWLSWLPTPLQWLLPGTGGSGKRNTVLFGAGILAAGALAYILGRSSGSRRRNPAPPASRSKRLVRSILFPFGFNPNVVKVALATIPLVAGPEMLPVSAGILGVGQVLDEATRTPSAARAAKRRRR